MTHSPHSRRGFTLVELLIVIVMLAGVMAVTFTLFQSQSRSFRNNTNRFDLVQNARGAMELTERAIRTMGAGVTGEQPVLVYGGDNVIAFNADYVERDTTDMRWAAYFNTDVPSDEAVAWLQGSATVIPNSSPSYTYPDTTYRLGNGAISPAETYTIYLQPDADTPRGDDYALWQRVNDGTPELLARSILPASGSRPFFEYLMQRTLGTGDTLITATGSLLPLIRRRLTGTMSATDSVNAVRPDSVRAIRMNYRITNGKSGTEERTREITTVIEVPNNGIPMPTVCGRAPYVPATFAATEVGTGLGTVNLSWTRSTDQDAGEVDVRQYVIWRRLSTEPAFNAPLLSVRAERDTVNYSTSITDNVPGSTYIFGIASQDCTPNFSTAVTTTITLSP
ncbi:MAG TPA: type II secretion system protein [Gemmatimonadales bacterium]|nr:type II secretion system protein [Gemmatimonadales bacterium]